MKRYLLMTALALVLVAPSAYAEYTGNGAIAPSSATSSPSAASQATTDTKDAIRDKWQKFKTDHEQTWEKLEAARKAHWHGVSMHMNKGESTDTPVADNGTAASETTAEGEAPQQDASDDGPRPSRWEKFKARHQDKIDDAKTHTDNAKEEAGETKSRMKDRVERFEEAHHDSLEHAKDKLHDWKDDHAEEIGVVKNSIKDKWEAFKEKHAQ